MLLWAIAYIPSLLSNLFSLAINYIPGATEMVTDANTWIASQQPIWAWAIAVVVVFFIASIIWSRLWIGLVKTNLMIVEDKKPVVKDLCVPWIYLLRLIWWWILVWLATLIGLIALVIPWIYIAVRLSMFKYFIAQGYGVIDSIKASWAITNGNVLKLIWIWFVYFWVTILWVIALVIWLLWAIPTIMLAQAYVYNQLKKNLPENFQPIN